MAGIRLSLSDHKFTFSDKSKEFVVISELFTKQVVSGRLVNDQLDRFSSDINSYLDKLLEKIESKESDRPILSRGKEVIYNNMTHQLNLSVEDHLLFYNLLQIFQLCQKTDGILIYEFYE